VVPINKSLALLQFLLQHIVLLPEDACRAFCAALHCRSGLGVEPIDEGRTLLQYLVGRASEGSLVGFLQQLEGQSAQLGLCDVQCSLASLEEVFLTIAKRVSGRSVLYTAYLRVITKMVESNTSTQQMYWHYDDRYCRSVA
jgi:hypothetical protein